MFLQALLIIFSAFETGNADDNTRNHHPNHRNSLMTLSDLTNHWIGIPNHPYSHYTATVSSTTTSTATPAPTSAPVSSKRASKIKSKRNRKTTKLPKRRRYDDDEDSLPYKDQSEYPDFDYDYESFNPSYRGPTSPPSSPYIMRSTDTTPKTVYLNPSGSSPSVSAIYAGTPKVATYVVPSAKKYVVQRVQSQTVYAPSAGSSSYSVYPSATGSDGVRRVDPMDYDDGNGAFLGPQNGFPPRPVMNKISEPGGRQPCHGPECHQHHKGLVRFYWRRVVYPEGRRGRRGRFRRPLRNRRRFGDRVRSPSDQNEMYASGDDDDGQEEDDDDEEEDNVGSQYQGEDDDEVDDDNDEEDNGNGSSIRNRWRPGRGYGHNLHEGKNYDESNKRVYRDKRFVYKQRRRFANNQSTYFQ